MNHQSAKRFVVGISGASGALYAQKLIQLLIAAESEVHLIVSPLGQRLLHDELGMEGIDLDALADHGSTPSPHAGTADLLNLYNYRDVGAKIATGSFSHDGMIVIPCSSNTLSAVATGSSNNLMHRAAHVALKERRRLILVHREMPLSLVDIRNMQAVTEAGGIMAPANPGFYMLPRTPADLVDFVVGRCLDLLGADHDLDVRWGEKKVTKELPRDF